MSEDLICHFGKHENDRLGDIPSGYLKWAVKTIDPVPLPKYQKNEDGSQKTVEEVKEMEANMSAFLTAAENELERREADGEKD